MTFAFLFFDSVGGGEWLVLLAVVLIVVGPKNLPAAARKMGQVLSQLRRAADEFKRQIMTMDQEMERAVNDVKKDYIDVAEDVDRTVTGEPGGEGSGAATEGESGPGGDLGDGEDLAYDSYGYDPYDETGESYYSDAGPSLEDPQPEGGDAAAQEGVAAVAEKEGGKVEDASAPQQS